MNSEGTADVVVAAQLRLDRESWISELQASTGDLERTAQAMSRTPMRVPVEFDRDSIQSAIRALQVELLSRPLQVPIQFVPTGATTWQGALADVRNSFANPYTAMAAGELPRPLIQPSLVGGYSGGAAAFAESRINTFGMSRSQIQQNIDEVSAQLDAGMAATDAAMMGASDQATQAALAQGYASGGGGGRSGFRFFAGLMLAARGLEAVHSSYEYAYGERDPELKAGSIAQLRDEERRLKEMRDGLMGLTGFGRDVLSELGKFGAVTRHGEGGILANFGRGLNWEFGRGAFDDAPQQRDLEARIAHEQRQQREIGLDEHAGSLLHGSDTFLDKAREQLRIAQSPEGLDKKMAELHAAATRSVDSFNKMADEIDAAADKLNGQPQLQNSMRERANILRTQGPVISGGIETAAGREVQHDFNVARATTRATLEAHIRSLGLSSTALSDELQGDTLGARMAEIEAQRDAASTAASNAYARQKPGDPQNITKSQLDQELSTINRNAELQNDLARQIEGQRTSRIEDAIHEAAIASPYAAQRDRIMNQWAENVKHATIDDRLRYDRERDAQIHRLDFEHTISLTRTFQTAREIDTASGGQFQDLALKMGYSSANDPGFQAYMQQQQAPRKYGETLGEYNRRIHSFDRFRPDPQLAEAQKLEHDEEEELSHEGGDKEAQRATREKYAALARAHLGAQGLNAKAKSVYDAIALGHVNPSATMGGPGGGGGGAGGGPGGGGGGPGDAGFPDAVKALKAAADKIANAQALYVVGG
jgi:hypothetical protein